MSRPLASLSLLRQAASVPSSSRAVHTTAFVQATQSPAKLRIKEERRLEKKRRNPGVPDYILGNIVAQADDRGRFEGTQVISSTWETSRLAKCIVHPKTIWEGPASHYTADGTPKYLLPGLSEDDKALLFGALPHVSTALQYDPNTTPEIRDEAVKQAMQDQEKQTQNLYRILDLKNASRSQINAYNRLRIIDEFGKGTDTGSSFVQAALLTLRIRSLNEHMLRSKHDIHNRIVLRTLIMKRARHLRYVKRKYPTQYDQLLLDIGVDRRAVEGELDTRL